MTTKIKNNKSLRAKDPRIFLIYGLIVVVTILIVGVGFAWKNKTPQDPSMGSVTINRQEFSVEIADTEDEQRLGLMFRKELPEKSGMLFIFDSLTQVPFWMRNTYLPLDIIFIGEDRKIINIVPMPPLTDDLAKPERSYRYVVELLRGSSQKFGLRPGQEVGIQLPTR